MAQTSYKQRSSLWTYQEKCARVGQRKHWNNNLMHELMWTNKNGLRTFPRYLEKPTQVALQKTEWRSYFPRLVGKFSPLFMKFNYVRVNKRVFTIGTAPATIIKLLGAKSRSHFASISQKTFRFSSVRFGDKEKGLHLHSNFRRDFCDEIPNSAMGLYPNQSWLHDLEKGPVGWGLNGSKEF